MSRVKNFSSTSFQNNNSSSQSPEYKNFRIKSPIKKKPSDKINILHIKNKQSTLIDGYSDKLFQTENKSLNMKNLRNYRPDSVNSFRNEGESLNSYRNKSECKNINNDNNQRSNLKDTESKQASLSFRKEFFTQVKEKRKHKINYKTKSSQLKSETFYESNKNTPVDEKNEKNIELNCFKSKNSQLNRKFLNSIRPITQKNSDCENLTRSNDLASFRERSNRKFNFSEEEFSELTLTNNDNFKRNLLFVDFNDKKYLNIRSDDGWKKGDEKKAKNVYSLFLTEKEHDNGINGCLIFL